MGWDIEITVLSGIVVKRRVGVFWQGEKRRLVRQAGKAHTWGIFVDVRGHQMERTPLIYHMYATTPMLLIETLRSLPRATEGVFQVGDGQATAL